MKWITRHTRYIAQDRLVLLLLLLFLLVQAALYSRTGTVTILEAEKYIREGTELASNGRLTETRFIFYLPVILLIAVCKLTGASLFFVVLFQVLLSAISLYCFYRVAEHLTTRKWALGVSVLLAVCIPVQQWNMYLYSDSIFISLSIIFFSILYFTGIKKTIHWPLFIFMLPAWCLARPAGLLFILPVFIFLLSIKPKQKLYIIAAVAAFVLIFLAAGSYFNGGGDLDTLKPYIEEHIICFVPQNTKGAALDVVRTGNQLNDLFYYILHNPVHFISLLFQKLVSFFNLTRPWYSSFHNIALIVLMVPVYLFFIPGFFRLYRHNRAYALFLISVFIMYPVGVVLQCDDWHSRFTMPVFPLMILVAGYGLFRLVASSKK
jgi:4-amino-4-deoxy-L-arabinose transferase-like glycosyltransferase